MGTEAVWVPLVMAAVAGGTTYVNNRRTAKKQDRELAEQIKSRSKKQELADKKVNDLISETGASDAADEKGGILKQYLSQLKAAQPSAAGGIQVGGANQSQAYRDDAAKAAMGVEKFGARRADLLSTMDAAAMQRQGEGLDRANVGTEIGQIARQDQGDTFVSNTKIKGIRNNPWLDAIAAAASAYGGSYTGGGSGMPANGGIGGSGTGYLGWGGI